MGGVHRKLKLIKMVRIGDLCTILKKEKGLGLQKEASTRNMTRNYGNQWKSRVISIQFVYECSLCSYSVCNDESLFSLRVKERDTLTGENCVAVTKEICILLLCGKGRVENFYICSFSIAISSK